MAKREKEDYTDEKTAKAFRLYMVTEIEPASIQTLVKRVGHIPELKVQLRVNSAFHILRTLEQMQLVYQEPKTKRWARTHKKL